MRDFVRQILKKINCCITNNTRSPADNLNFDLWVLRDIIQYLLDLVGSNNLLCTGSIQSIYSQYRYHKIPTGNYSRGNISRLQHLSDGLSTYYVQCNNDQVINEVMIMKYGRSVGIHRVPTSNDDEKKTGSSFQDVSKSFVVST